MSRVRAAGGRVPVVRQACLPGASGPTAPRQWRSPASSADDLQQAADATLPACIPGASGAGDGKSIQRLLTDTPCETNESPGVNWKFDGHDADDRDRAAVERDLAPDRVLDPLRTVAARVPRSARQRSGWSSRPRAGTFARRSA